MTFGYPEETTYDHKVVYVPNSISKFVEKEPVVEEGEKTSLRKKVLTGFNRLMITSSVACAGTVSGKLVAGCLHNYSGKLEDVGTLTAASIGLFCAYLIGNYVRDKVSE